MDQESTFAVPNLAAGGPLRELVLAVASGSRRNRAMSYAGALGERWGLPVRIVHVSGSVSSVDPELAAVVDEFRPWYPKTAVDAKHLYGDDPARALADDLTPQSLAILSTDNADGWSSNQSVAESLVRAAGIPVLLVGPQAGKPHLEGEVIVALDGSDVAESALGPAVAVARALERRLWLVLVVPQPTATPEAGREPSPAGTGSWLAERPGRYLQDIAERYDAETETRWEVIFSNDPVDAIETFARRRRAGFIVTGTESRADSHRHAVRSTTMALVAVAERPVLVVRSDTGSASGSSPEVA